MKRPKTFTVCLALLTLGLTGCSQNEWADSASGESAFAKETPATTVAELTQRLKDYNASLSIGKSKVVTTRMSRNDKWRLGRGLGGRRDSLRQDIRHQEVFPVNIVDLAHRLGERKDGVYQVSLIEDSHVIDTKKFVK